jgi:hypothetical protein
MREGRVEGGEGRTLTLYRHISELNIFPFDKNKAFFSAMTLVFLGAQSIYNLVKLFGSLW